MAATTTVSMAAGELLLLLLSLLSLSTLPAHSTEFAVAGDGNWTIPSSKDSEFYNKWAAANRFQVGDTIHFKYKKDSVMVVSEKDYNKCSSIHPIFFSNTGKTEFALEKPGLFYFISGVDGHCERGEKMIIKVMAGPVSPGGPCRRFPAARRILRR
ncbi:Early nodulin-like protein 1 [Platanthera zijinensis]|uniref:Early nodulin-like protein 1 n=1 Tax=Platanthera zijinensis TaxID=2320716 RepID=A0AAP0AS46_9ASPA